MTLSKPLVLYHGPGCRDGWCAAFLAHLRFPGAELVPQEYGDPAAFDGSKLLLRVRGEERSFDLEGRDVLMLDWSPNSRKDPHFATAILDGIHVRARSITVLDHHEKQEPILAHFVEWATKIGGKEPPRVVFDVNRSGAGIALDEFFPGARTTIAKATHRDWTDESLPLIENARSTAVIEVALRCEAWDLWEHDRYDDVKEVCAYLDTVDRSTEAWTKVIRVAESEYGIEDLAERGAAVLAYQKQQVERIVAHARPGNFDNVPANVVNTPVLQSEVGEALYRKDPKKISVVWYEHEEGVVVVSLRSHEDGPDVGELAKRRGGGGHKHSAGCRMTWSDFAPVGAYAS